MSVIGMTEMIRLKKVMCPIYNKVAANMKMSSRKRALFHLLHMLRPSNTDRVPQIYIGAEVIIVLSIGLQR